MSYMANPESWYGTAMVLLQSPPYSWCPVSGIVLCFLTLLLVLVLVAMQCHSPPGNLPPGPPGLPFLGYLPFLGKQAYKKLFTLSRKYGPVFSLYLGRRFVVVLNTLETVKEALTNPHIMDRPEHPPNHLMPNSTSLSISNGAVWKEQRNFAVQVFRKLGMGKQAVEERIQAEILRLQQEIDSKGGQPMNLARLLLPSVSNVVLSLLSVREDDGGQRRDLIDSVLRMMTLYFRPTRIHAFFPGLRKWMARWGIWGYDEVQNKMTALSTLIETEIDYHRRTLDPDSVRDYIDAFLITQKDLEGSTTFTDTMLRGNVQSLLGAGSTPSRAALEWCLVSVAVHPEVQDRVFKEVTEALGTENRPSWSNRHRTPYTVAVILEAMRHHTVIPISMLRTNSKPCRIGGFDIPAGTLIMTNIWAVHHDPAHWERPDEFWPGHFLDDDGKLMKPPSFIPFSYGKRNCPGEDLAMAEVYLYFVSLVQRYRVLPQEAGRSFRTLLGIANMAVPDGIRMIQRSQDTDRPQN